MEVFLKKSGKTWFNNIHNGIIVIGGSGLILAAPWKGY